MQLKVPTCVIKSESLLIKLKKLKALYAFKQLNGTIFLIYIISLFVRVYMTLINSPFISVIYSLNCELFFS